jgi:hypothetical protein
MDNKQKVMIAVLVAVVLLFVVAIAVGTQSGEGDAKGASEDRDGLLASLGGDPATVPPDQLGGDCERQGTTLVVEGSCDLDVPAADDRMRLVRLRVQQGSVDVSAPAPEDADFDIEKELPDDEGKADVAIAVDREGTTIDLNCIGLGQTCTVVLLGADQ